MMNKKLYELEALLYAEKHGIIEYRVNEHLMYYADRMVNLNTMEDVKA